MKPLVILQSVSKTYRDITALDKVNLEILEGEVLSLLGPNGSGKTTLLKIMAGIEKPTSGEMRFKDASVNEINTAQLRLKTTMVFQKTTLFSANVYQNIAYGLKIRGLSKMETRGKVKEVLTKVRLEGYEKRQAKKLSGGEQQRVALARALVLEPELLLLDEPTANIDPKNVSIIEDALAWVNKQERTTLVIATHNMFQAETLANRAALLLEGRIAKVGTPQDILSLPPKLLANYARLENIFSGISRVNEGGTSTIDVGQGQRIEAAFQKDGNISVHIRPEDIILSIQPIVSSARNTFVGRITEIFDLGSSVKLKINAGKDFTAQITKRSFNEMGLNLNSKVFIAFKASAIQTI